MSSRPQFPAKAAHVAAGPPTTLAITSGDGCGRVQFGVDHLLGGRVMSAPTAPPPARTEPTPARPGRVAEAACAVQDDAGRADHVHRRARRGERAGRRVHRDQRAEPCAGAGRPGHPQRPAERSPRRTSTGRCRTPTRPRTARSWPAASSRPRSATRYETGHRAGRARAGDRRRRAGTRRRRRPEQPAGHRCPASCPSTPAWWRPRGPTTARPAGRRRVPARGVEPDAPELLPAAQRALRRRDRRPVSTDQDRAAALPVVEILLGLPRSVRCSTRSVYVRRRTNAAVNVGLGGHRGRADLAAVGADGDHRRDGERQTRAGRTAPIRSRCSRRPGSRRCRPGRTRRSRWSPAAAAPVTRRLRDGARGPGRAARPARRPLGHRRPTCGR